jgi:hypothetical protein
MAVLEYFQEKWKSGSAFEFAISQGSSGSDFRHHSIQVLRFNSGLVGSEQIFMRKWSLVTATARDGNQNAARALTISQF